jgi:hypothetical protein
MKALEVGLFFEPRSLASSELRIDEYELWADGLGLHAGIEGSSFWRRPLNGSKGHHHALKLAAAAADPLSMRHAEHSGEEPGGVPSKGDRIVLLRTQTGVQLRGTVFYSDQLQILVKWDNGQSQSLRVGVDRYRIIE